MHWIKGGSKLTPKGLQCPKWIFSIFSRFSKLQKFVDGFEILHNCVLVCHLFFKIILIQNKLTVTDEVF